MQVPTHGLQVVVGLIHEDRLLEHRVNLLEHRPHLLHSCIICLLFTSLASPTATAEATPHSGQGVVHLEELVHELVPIDQETDGCHEGESPSRLAATIDHDC